MSRRDGHEPEARTRRRREWRESRREGMVEEQQEGEGKWREAEWGGKAGGQYEGEGRDKEGREGGGRGRKVEGRIGTRPTHNTLFHLILERSMRGLEYTQCTVNLEHSNALSTQCTRSNGHSALSATHLLDTKVPVRACVWSHVPVSPADLPGPLSLSVPHPGLVSPRSSRLRLILRRPTVYVKTLGRELESVDTSCDQLKKN